MTNLSVRVKLTYGSCSVKPLYSLRALCTLRPDWTLEYAEFSFRFSSMLSASLLRLSVLVLLHPWYFMFGAELESRLEAIETSAAALSVCRKRCWGIDQSHRIGIFTCWHGLLLRRIILDTTSGLDARSVTQNKTDNTNFRRIGRNRDIDSSVGLKHQLLIHSSAPTSMLKLESKRLSNVFKTTP